MDDADPLFAVSAGVLDEDADAPPAPTVIV